MDTHEMKGKTCNCTHHKVIPVLVILIGVDFLLGAIHIFTWGFVDVTWPILLIIGGAGKLSMGRCTCC